MPIGMLIATDGGDIDSARSLSIFIPAGGASPGDRQRENERGRRRWAVSIIALYHHNFRLYFDGSRGCESPIGEI